MRKFSGIICLVALTSCLSPAPQQEVLSQVDLSSLRGKMRIVSSALAPSQSVIESALIRVKKVQVRRVGVEEGSPFLTFTEMDFDLDLVQLAQGVDQLLAKAKLPVGHYDQIRLITENQGVVTHSDQTTYPLTIPSGSQTGLKIFGEFHVVEGKILKVNLEFDLWDSFVEIGGVANLSAYNFMPVIHASMDLIDDPNAGGGSSGGGSSGSGGTGSGSGSTGGEGGEEYPDIGGIGV